VPERLSNWQIAAAALWALGGATVRTETEDIAELCWRWAPERFGWKRHPYPDIRIAGEALRDAKKSKNGRLMDGEEKEGGWLLTEAGLSWIGAHRRLVDSLATVPGRSALPKTQDRVLQSLLNHSVYVAWRTGRTATRSDIADAMEVTADAPTSVVRARLASVANAASLAGDSQLTELTRWLQETLEQLA
jgi:hypothetical protein